MSTATSGLLDGGREPGVYRVLGDRTEIAEALRLAGWATAVVPSSSSTEAFYSAVATSLNLPAYFGRNLDALWDVLTDLDQPTALVLVEWTNLARANPEAWKPILEVLTERTAQEPAFAIVLA